MQAHATTESEVMDKTLTVAAVPHSYDGSSYYRIWLPFARLGDQSRHITGVQDPKAGMPGPADVEGLDVCVFQRPAGRHGSRMLERLVGYTKLVYEVDDDMLNADSSGIPHLVDERLRSSVRRCLRLCDAVTTTNEYLAETIRPYNENVFVLPNHIKAGLLRVNRPVRDRLTVGWAGGTSHLADMVTIGDPLRNVLDANPDVDMHFIGADLSPLVHQPPERRRWTMWEPDVGEYYKHIDFDIAVAPSADIPFNRSKTPLRALEMGALGIPVVAANRLPYSDYVVDGKTGFLCDTAADWEEALTSLIHDEDMRAEMGAAGKAQASEWTIEQGWTKWQTVYETIAGGK